MVTWSREDRRMASFLIEGVLIIAFVVGLYFAGIEAYKIRLYAIKTFGARCLLAMGVRGPAEM